MSREEISFYPHHAVMTECEQNFQNHSEAFAEFFDNSIQACHHDSLNNDPNYRHTEFINLSLYLSRRLEAGYAVIYDNGCGMDSKDINNFASLGLNEEKRKISNAAKLRNTSGIGRDSSSGPNHYLGTSESASHLSKYGVGAKQAAFSIGTRLKIISRKAFSKDPEAELVKEFYVSGLELDDKFTKTGEAASVYKGEILSRPLMNFDILESTYPNHVDPLEKKSDFKTMLEDIKRHEQDFKSHFNILIINLKEKVVRQFLEDDEFMNLRNNLSCCYTFYLSPEYKFNSLVNNNEKEITKCFTLSNKRKSGLINGTTPNKKSSSRSSNSKKPKKSNLLNDASDEDDDDDNSQDDLQTALALTAESSDENSLANSRITMQLCRVIDDGYKHVTDLNSHEGNYYKNCIEAAKPGCGFAFNFSFNDPDYHTDNHLTESCNKTHEVSCLLFYYPFEEGYETKPPYITSSLNMDDNIGISRTQTQSNNYTQQQTTQGGNSSSSSVTTNRISIYNDEPQDDMFSVFWINRELSQSKVKILMPLCPKTYIDKFKGKYSDKWKHRLKGFMFLDRSFEPISNNKLKVRLDGGLEKYLNDPKNKVDIDKKIKDSFFVWLEKMKSEYDQDYKLMGRMLEYERLNSHASRNKSYFSMFLMGKHMIEVNMIYQFDTTKKKESNGRESISSNSNAKPRIIYGRIARFEVEEALPSDKNESTLECKIQVFREPKNRYGDEIMTFQPSNLVMVNKQSVAVSQVDLTELRKAMPASVDIAFYLQTEKISNDLKILHPNKPFTVKKGIFFKLGIQILNEKKKNICFMPQTENREKKRLQVVDGSEFNCDTASGSNLEEFDPDTNSFNKVPVRNSADQDLSHAFYMFHNMSLNSCGLNEFQLQIRDPSINGRVVFPFSLNADAPPPEELWYTACIFQVPHESVTLDLEWFKKEQQQEEDSGEDDKIRCTRLNDFIPGFKITMRNGDGQKVNLNEDVWVEFSIYNAKLRSVLQIVSVGESDTDYLVETMFPMNNESYIDFENSWKVVMKDPARPLDQFTKKETVGKEIELHCSLQLFHVKTIKIANAEVPAKGDSICEKNSFFLKLYPGKPEQIRTTSTALDFINGEPATKLIFEVLDESRHRTYPIEDEKWDLVFDPEGPIQCQEPQEIRANGTESGTCILKEFEVLIDPCPPGGRECDQHVYLDTGLRNSKEYELRSIYNLNDPNHYMKYFKKLQNHREVKYNSFPFNIKYKKGDMQVKLMRNDEEIIEGGNITGTAGGKIVNITFGLFDDDGHLVHIDPEWFTDASCGYKTSWSTTNNKKKGNKLNKSLNGSLPDINLPKAIDYDDPEHHYSFELHLPGIIKKEYVCSFTVTTEPSSPNAWMIELAPNTIENGIMLSSEDDVFRKILGVKLVDQFKNVVDASVYPTLIPVLEICFSKPSSREDDNAEEKENETDIQDELDEDDDDVISLKLEYRRGSGKEKLFLVDTDQSLPIPMGNHDTSSLSQNNFIWIRAMSAKSSQLSTSSETSPRKYKNRSSSSSSSNSSSNGHLNVNSLLTAIHKCPVIAGWPENLVITSVSENIYEFSSTTVTAATSDTTDNQIVYSLTANRFSKGTIYLSINDVLNQTSSLDMIQKLKFSLIDQEDVVKINDVPLSKEIKSLANIPIEIDFNWDVENITIFLSVSYYRRTDKKGGDSNSSKIHRLEPIRLVCTLLPINYVRSLKFQTLSVATDHNTDTETNDDVECNMEEVGPDHNNSSCNVTIKSGDPMPTIQVYMITDDNKPLTILSEESIEIKLNRKKTGNVENTNFKLSSYEDYFTLVCHSNIASETNALSYIELVPIADDIEDDNERKVFHTHASIITIDVTYLEKRDDLKQFLGRVALKCQSKMEIKVLPDKPHHLAFDSKSSEKLDSVAVSGCIIADPLLRNIGENIKVYIVDQYGNIASDAYENNALVCFISSPSSSDTCTDQQSSVDNIPQLEESERPSDEELLNALQDISCGHYTNNYILRGECKPLHKNGITGFLFKSLQIKPNTGDKTNEYNLVFMLVPQSNPLTSSSYSSSVVTVLEPLVVSFQFQMDDNDIVNQAREMKNSMKDLKPKIIVLNGEICAFTNEIIKLEKLRNKELQKTNYEGREFSNTNTQTVTYSATSGNDGDSDTQYDRLLEYKARQEQVLKDVKCALWTSQQSLRAAVVPPNALTRHKDINFRRVIDIGFVDNEIDAKIMSYVAREKIDAFITDTLDESTNLYKKLKLKVWPLEGLRTISYKFLCPGQGVRPRSDEETMSHELPGLKPLHHLPGNPAYMINTIQLLEADEKLRDSVFWNIFRESIIFDTYEDAITYKKILLSKNAPRFPNMYTRTGDVIPSDGCLIPNQGNKNRLDCVKYIFGQRPSENAGVEKKLVEEIDTLNKAIELNDRIRKIVAERDSKVRTLEELELVYESSKSKLKALTDEGYRLSQIA